MEWTMNREIIVLFCGMLVLVSCSGCIISNSENSNMDYLDSDDITLNISLSKNSYTIDENNISITLKIINNSTKARYLNEYYFYSGMDLYIVYNNTEYFWSQSSLNYISTNPIKINSNDFVEKEFNILDHFPFFMKVTCNIFNNFEVGQYLCYMTYKSVESNIFKFNITL